MNRAIDLALAISIASSYKEKKEPHLQNVSLVRLV